MNTKPDKTITNKILSRSQRVRLGLSPWVRQMLQGQPTSAVKRVRQSALAVSTAHTSNLLNRVQRQSERTVVWQPSKLSVTPELVDRFSEVVAQRYAYSAIAVKPTPTAVEARPDSRPDALPLAGQPAASTQPELTRPSSPQPKSMRPSTPPQKQSAVTEASSEPAAPKPHFMAQKKQDIRPSWLRDKLPATKPAEGRASTDIALQKPSIPGQPAKIKPSSQNLRLFSKVEYLSDMGRMTTPPEVGKNTQVQPKEQPPKLASTPPASPPLRDEEKLATRPETKRERSAITPPPAIEAKPTLNPPEQVISHIEQPPISAEDLEQSSLSLVEPAELSQLDDIVIDAVDPFSGDITQQTKPTSQPKPSQLPKSKPSISPTPPPVSKVSPKRATHDTGSLPTSEQAALPKLSYQKPTLHRKPDLVDETNEPSRPESLTSDAEQAAMPLVQKASDQKPAFRQKPNLVNEIDEASRAKSSASEVEQDAMPLVEKASYQKPALYKKPDLVEKTDEASRPESLTSDEAELSGLELPKRLGQLVEKQETLAKTWLTEKSDVSGQTDAGQGQTTLPPAKRTSSSILAQASSVKPTKNQQLLLRQVKRVQYVANQPSPSSLFTLQQARTRLIKKGWRFKQKKNDAPTKPDQVNRALTRLEQQPGPGRPLPAEPRARVEETLGRDFSRVRVQTAPLSSLNVEAATQGSNIYVEPGQDRFDTPSSLALLGHELTHVKQQNVAMTKPLLQTTVLPQTNDDYDTASVARDESEAIATERQLLRQPAPAKRQMPVIARQRNLEPLGPRPAEQSVQRQLVLRKAEGPAPPAVAPRIPQPQVAEVGIPAPVADWLTTTSQADRHPLVSPAPKQQVFRQTEASAPAADTAEPEATDTEAETDEAAAAQPDLDQLARQILPLIKRMLKVDKERRPRSSDFGYR